jgi:hypothetical protein
MNPNPPILAPAPPRRQPLRPSRRGAPTWWPEPETTPSSCLAHGSAPGPAYSRRLVVARAVGVRRARGAAEAVEDPPCGPRVEHQAAERERAAAAGAREAVYPKHPLQQVAPARALAREPHARMPREPLGATRLGLVGGLGGGGPPRRATRRCPRAPPCRSPHLPGVEARGRRDARRARTGRRQGPRFRRSRRA